jgi:tetratricopeptide (TPR) repeat protein
MKLLKILYKITLIGLFLSLLLSGPALGHEEAPLKFPAAEGSKSFDFEVDHINDRGIQLYQQGHFRKSIYQFKKALSLSQQLRDPGQGILNYNLALSLHKIGLHEKAAEQFYEARRFARGNKNILGSELLKMHECWFNPIVPCK